jgi:hypothetical protein
MNKREVTDDSNYASEGNKTITVLINEFYIGIDYDTFVNPPTICLG